MASDSLSLTLFRGFPISASYVWSPFVTKLEARFRFAGLAYKLDEGAPPKGPRGKVPYIAISKTSDAAPEVISDTTLISKRFVADGLAEDLNGKLTAAEKAQDLAVRALLEDKLFFYQVRGLSSSLFPIVAIPMHFFMVQSQANRYLHVPRLIAVAATTRNTNAGSKITTRCVPKFSPPSLIPYRSSSGNLPIAGSQGLSTAKGRGDSLPRRLPSLRQKSGRT